MQSFRKNHYINDNDYLMLVFYNILLLSRTIPYLAPQEAITIRNHKGQIIF